MNYQITTVASNASTFDAVGLPAELSINKTNGLIIGTPLASSLPSTFMYKEFTVTLSAANGSGTGTKTLTLILRHRQRPISIPSFPTNLESRSGAPNVIYLDFDGESFTSPKWNNNQPLVCSPSGLNDTEVRQIFEAVKEDFRPFNVNVTTNLGVYNAAARPSPPFRRIRMLITPTDTFIPSTDGRLFSADAACDGGSFSQANWTSEIDPTYPGFAWIKYFNQDGTIYQAPRDIASSISHELGHAFNLGHDGGQATYAQPVRPGYGEYFHGTGRGISVGPSAKIGGSLSNMSVWVPQMGSNTKGLITQWSKGDYWGYSSDQIDPDDVSIIAQSLYNGGYAPDVEGNSVGSATFTSVGDAFVFDGSIGRTGSGGYDIDVIQFTLDEPGVLNLLASPREPMRDIFPNLSPLEQQTLNLGITNLYMTVELLDGTGAQSEVFSKGSETPYSSSNPNGLEPTEFFRRYLTNKRLSAGTWYLRISGAGRGDPVNTQPTLGTIEGGATVLVDIPGYFSAYGSMGAYKLRGTMDYDPVMISASSAAGSVGWNFSHPVVATHSPTSYDASNLPPGLVIDTNTGLISGVPVSPGVWVVTIGAFRNAAVGYQSLTITITGTNLIGDATDAPNLNWTTPSGFFGWFNQTLQTQDGADAAQSADIGDNEKAAMQTTVTGPGNLSFYWKVSSETRWDALRFELDGVVQGSPISGETMTTWAFVSIPVPAGTHTLRWIYEKDGSRSLGSDAGWVDQVVWAEYPVITAPVSDTWEEGQPYTNQIVATGGTLTYGVSGTKIAGLDVNAQTGAIFGTPTVSGPQSMILTAANTASTATKVFSLMVNPSPPNALDNTLLAFNRPDAKKWFGQKVESWDGVDSMQSPALNHSESSTIETTVVGPGTINYYWKANSEIGDVLTLRIGANTVDSVSGSTGWVSRTQSVPAGVQTLRWTFTRNASGDGGSNSVWLDRVSFTGATGPTITSPLSVNWTAGQFYYIPLTSDDPTTVWSIGPGIPTWMFFINAPSIPALGSNPTASGTFSFNIFATSSLGTTTRAFTINVQSSYAAWATANGLGVGSELGDQDKDGLTNFAEFTLVLDPLVRNNGYQPVSYDPATKRLRAVFKILSSQYNPDIKYEVQVSPNLQTWTTIAQGFGNTQIENLGGSQSVTANGQEFTVIDGTAQTAAVPKRWMRVKVSQLK